VPCGKNKTALARFVPNGRLIYGLHRLAPCSLAASPGTRAHYDELTTQAARPAVDWQLHARAAMHSDMRRFCAMSHH
jgi:hypothetical protein